MIRQRATIVACYYPREDSWSWFHGPELPGWGDGKLISRDNELYFISESVGPLRYDAPSDVWESIQYMYSEPERILNTQSICWK